MNTIIIDLKNVQTHDEFYKEIISSFGFPNWCGDSPDAIWDLLTGYFGTPAEITVTGIENIPVNLLAEWQICKKTFADAEAWFKKHNETIRFIYK